MEGRSPHRVLPDAPEALPAVRPAEAPEALLCPLLQAATHLFQVPFVTVAFEHHDGRWRQAHVGADVCEAAPAFHAAVLAAPGAVEAGGSTDGDALPFAFLAGAPLRMPDDQPFGTLLLADRVPRRLGAQQRAALVDLAAAAARLLGLHLREQGAHLLVEHATDIISRFDPALRHLYVNPAVERFSGIPRHAFIGRTHRELGIPEPHATHFQALLRRVFETGEELIDEFTFPTPAGLAFFQSRLVPERDAGGAVTTVLSIARDMTAHRAAEVAVQENERLLRAFVDAAFEGTALSVDSVFIQANEALARLFGYDRATDLIGLGARDISTPEGSEEALRRLRTGYDRPYEIPGRRRDGSLFPMEVIGKNVVYRGQPARITGFRDITERKRFEQELIEARDRAEEMSRLKTAFLHNMSHEIRTPLTSILGFADLLHGAAEGEGRAFAALIRRGGERLMHTLNALLDLAQLESHSRAVRREPLRLAPAVAETLRRFEAQAAEHGLSLRLDVDDPALEAWLDRSALDRILVHLLSNALKFTARGGVTVRLRQDAHATVLQVEDTGAGIDPAFLPHLFDAFKQESSGLARRHEGTGLGLAITKGLVELLGGAITVESRKGEGSTFTLAFPHDAA